MSALELLKPTPSTGAGLEKMAHNYEGLLELLEILQTVRDALRGNNVTGIEQPPAEKPPTALLDLVDAQARAIGRCHQMASDIRKIVL